MEDETLNSSVKGYFGKDILFRKDKTGRTVFYPFGALSKGYCVLDSSKQEDIKNLLMLNTAIWMVVASICIFIAQEKPLALLFLAIFLLLSGVLYRIKIRKLLRGLEVIDVGSESYSPPMIDRRYRGLLLVILIGGLVGGIGNIYNKGFSISDLILASGSAAVLLMLSYLTWFRK